jgi:hypothetical protein
VPEGNAQRIPIDLVQIMKKINLNQESQLLYLERSNLREDRLHPDQRCPHMEARETVKFDSAKMKEQKIGVVPKINSVVHIWVDHGLDNFPTIP